jgi:hypothetical protein
MPRRRGGAAKGFECKCLKKGQYVPKPHSKYKRDFTRCEKYKCDRVSNARGEINPWQEFVSFYLREQRRLLPDANINLKDVLQSPTTVTEYKKYLRDNGIKPMNSKYA